ncbi:hypothetical protein N7535_003428 [Penicillium sp. DV-2018c]|nr:hypothetical protein N7461_000876 [Penicillium sp. DV-2018c]KAJ5576502.1 hypothetical protein N7535_003428 [Penicillium sp. DV-2018c]
MDPTRGAEIPSDTPPTTPAQEYEYGKWQVDGAKRQHWIEDATDDTCEIEPSTLTVQDLHDMGYHVRFDPEPGLPDVLSDDVLSLGYSLSQMTQCMASRRTIDSKRNNFLIIAGTELAVVEKIFRYDGLQFSQVAVTMMRHVMEPESLRHLYFADIVNEDTKEFFKSMLYTERNGLEWPPITSCPDVWDYNTPQYQGLLGTRIGKCAAHLVLEAFPRGTYRIARVVTWYCSPAVQMRFDVEPIPAPASPATAA